MAVLSPLFRLKTVLPVAAVALGLGLASAPAFAQHGGGHGGGGGGGHAGGGAVHGGGGFHGGGGWHGGWGHDWHGGWGFYGGFYPWYGYGGWGWDPFWAYDYGPYPYSYYPAPPDYGPPPADYPSPGAYDQQQYGPQQYGPPPVGSTGMPTDNSRGFYTWRLGVEGGTCNRPELQRYAVNLTGAQPAGLQAGAVLGGIPVQHVIGGRIGPRLDLTDQACAAEALEHAQVGATVRWETANAIPITFRVIKTTDDGNGQCRDFEATAQFGSHVDTVRNTACKGEDGAWRPTR
jgi:surface antigen